MAKGRVPRAGEQVYTNSHKGNFTVVRVDEAAGLADLQLIGGTKFIEKSIPFSDIHLIREDVNQGAARIVREATKSD